MAFLIKSKLLSPAFEIFHYLTSPCLSNYIKPNLNMIPESIPSALFRDPLNASFSPQSTPSMLILSLALIHELLLGMRDLSLPKCYNFQDPIPMSTF